MLQVGATGIEEEEEEEEEEELLWYASRCVLLAKRYDLGQSTQL
jgi:hypothetical protein